MKATKIFVFVLSIITGAVVGGLIAQATGNVEWLQWLSYGVKFGVSTEEPFLLDLVILKIAFGFMVDINIASIAGIVGALLLFRKLA